MRKRLTETYAVSSSKCDALICVTLLHAVRPGGVMSFQFVPPSLVVQTSPSSVPAQTVFTFWNDGAILDHSNGMPIAKGDRPIIAAARNAYRAAFLLCSANLVRKSIGYAHVIHLRRRLVVPGTPGFTAIHR